MRMVESGVVEVKAREEREREKGRGEKECEIRIRTPRSSELVGVESRYSAILLSYEVASM